MSEPPDDLTRRGRAIFDRLRSAETGPPAGEDDERPDTGSSEEESPDPASAGAPPAHASSTAPDLDEAIDSDADPGGAGTPADAPSPDAEPAPAVAPEFREASSGETAPASDREGPSPTSGGPAPPTMPTGLPGLDRLPPSDAVEDASEAVAELTGDAGPTAGPLVRPLPRILAVANQKGGVGKTTTAVNLGASLADLGYRVLVVDLDPQGNASTGLGINIRDLQTSMYDVMLHDTPIDDTLEATSVRNLFVAPSSLDLAGAEIELVPAFSREQRLKRALAEVVDDYDYVVIDCPPSLGLLTVNGLAAASEVVVPIQCEYYALEGLGQLLRNIDLVKRNLNPALELSTIVLVMYDARTKLADQVAQEVRSHFGDKVARMVVPRTVRLSEAPSYGQPILAFDPASRGAIAYQELAREMSGGPA